MSERLSSQKSAKLYGVTNDYIARLCRNGKVAGVLENRTWMVDQKSLAEFFARQGKTPLREGERGELLTSREASRLYRVTNDYVARLCRQGKLDGVFANGIWKVRKSSLDTFFAPRREAVVASEPTKSVELAHTPAQPVFRKVFSQVSFAEQTIPHNKKFAFAAGVVALVVVANAVALAGTAFHSASPAAVASLQSPFFGGDLITKIFSSFFGTKVQEEPTQIATPNYQTNVPVASAPVQPIGPVMQTVYQTVARTSGDSIPTDTLLVMLGELHKSVRGEVSRMINATLDADFFSSSNSGGGSGGLALSDLTDANIPDTITASNYLPLAGGTLTGALSGTSATFSGTASTSALVVSGLNSANCDVKASATGVLSCGSDSTGAGGGDFPFTPTAWGNSTSTTIGFTNGIIANASSTFAAGLNFTNFSNGSLAVNSSGGVYTAATTTFSAPLVYSNGNVTFTQSGASTDGYLSSTDWNLFNNKVSSSSLATLLTSAYPFPLTGNATSTLTQFNGGLTAYASSTIGGGTQTTGLTVNGGATTTGSAYIAGSLGIGVSAPNRLLNVVGGTNTTETILAELRSNHTGPGTGTSLRFTNSTSPGAGNGASEIAAVRYTDGISGNLFIRTANPSAVLTDRISIFGITGNVGIGSSTPSYRLSVEGESSLGNIARAGYFIATSTTASTFPFASTTAISGIISQFTTASSSNLYISSVLSSLLKTDTSGLVSAAVAGTDYVTPSGLTAAFPFTPTSAFGSAANATSTLIGFTNGIYSLASSTIGSGAQDGGLTISGGATTTGNAYFAANVGIGTAAPSTLLQIGDGANDAIATFTDGASTLQTTLDFQSTGISGPSSEDGWKLRLWGSGTYEGGDYGLGITGSTLWMNTGGTNIDFYDGGTEVGTFENGLFGVGTTTPWAKLSVTNTGTGPSFVVEDSTSPDSTPFIIDASGSVGVGTSSPLRNFDVRGGSDSQFGIIDANTNKAWAQSVVSADGRFRIVESGVGERLSITTAGNVGIGTSTPAQKLDVEGLIYARGGGVVSAPWSGAAYVSATAQSGSDARLQTTVAGVGTWYLGQDASDSSNFKIAWNNFSFSAPVMTITTAGNVGIGTTSPYTTLSVQGNAGISGNLGVANITATGTVTTANLTVGTLNGLLKATAGVVSAAIAGTDYLTAANLTSAYPFPLTGNATSTLTQFNGGLTAYASSTIGDGTQSGGLTINGGATTTGNAYFAGNVGIGDATPSALLTVGNGDLFQVNSSGAITSSGGTHTFNGSGTNALEIGTTLSSQYAFIDLKGDTTYSDYGLRLIRNNTGADAPSALIHRGTGSLSFEAAEAAPILFKTIGIERLRITSAGNFGIGTTSPYARLSVEGSSALGNTATAGYFIATSTTASTFPFASTTAISGTISQFATASSTNLNISSVLSSLLKTNSIGGVVAAVAGTDYLTSANLTSAFPFTPTSAFGPAANATSTLIGFTNGIYSLASSTIGGGTQTTGLTINGGATTTGNAYFAGSVGVGTMTPTSALTVSSAPDSYASALVTLSASAAANNEVLNISQTNAGGVAAADQGLYIDNRGAGSSLAIVNNTTPIMRVLSSGNVGIGTTSPLHKLVVGSGTETARIYISGLAGGSDASARPTNDNAQLTLGRLGTSDGGGIEFNLSPSGSGYGFKINAPDADSRQDLRFFSRWNSATWTERLTLQGVTGNLGIGTTSPYAKLSVGGQVVGAYFTATTTTASTFPFASTTAISGTNATFTGNVGINSTGVTSAKLDVRTSGAGNVAMRLIADSFETAFRLSENSTFSNVDFAAVSGGSLRVDNAGYVVFNNTGNVGLGSTTPYSKLSVQKNYGNTGSSLFTVASSTASDGSTATTYLTVSDAGKVGVRTNSPGAYLAVNGSGVIGLANQTAYDVGAGTIGAGTSIYSYGSICTNNNSGACDGANGVVIGASNTTAYTNITSSGNSFFGGRVGFGTTTTSRTLQAEAASNAFLVYTSGVTNSSTSAAPTFVSPKGTVSMFIGSGHGTNSGQESVASYGVDESSGNIRFNGTSVAWGDFGYYPNGGGNGNYGNFRLSLAGSTIDTVPDAKLGVGSLYSAGNIGIGTTTPQQSLTINNTSGSATIGSWGTASTNAASDVIVANSIGGAFQYAQAKIQVQRTSSLGQGWNFLVANNSAGTISEAMRITSEGLVGIGTSTPTWLLNPTSATAAQLSLSAGAGFAQWAFRNASGNLYLATTTVAGTATTTTSALTINGLNGHAFFSSNVGFATSTASSTIELPGTGSIGFSTQGTSGRVELSNLTGALLIRNPDTTTNNTSFRLLPFTTGIWFQNTNTSGEINFSGLNGASLTGDILFRTTAEVGFGTTSPWGRMSVDSSSLAAGIPSFVVGSSTRTDLMVTQAGHVGIGTNSPQRPLHIASSGSPTTVWEQTSNGTDLKKRFITNGSLGQMHFGKFNDSMSVSTIHLTLDTDGNLLPNTDNTQDFGSTALRWDCLYYDATVLGTCASDERLKNSIEDFSFGESPLTQLSGLRPRTFEMNDAPGLLSYGLVAQEVQAVAPDLVEVGEDGYLQVRYGRIQYLTIEAIKEMHLNFETIASSTASSTPESESFAERFMSGIFARMTAWLADAGNGIANLFAATITAETVYAKNIHASETICVDGECLTKDDIRNILQVTRGSSSNTPSADPEPTPEPEPAPEETPNETPDEETSGEIVTEEDVVEENNSDNGTEGSAEQPADGGVDGAVGEPSES